MHKLSSRLLGQLLQPAPTGVSLARPATGLDGSGLPGALQAALEAEFNSSQASLFTTVEAAALHLVNIADASCRLSETEAE